MKSARADEEKTVLHGKAMVHEEKGSRFILNHSCGLSSRQL